MIDEPRIWRAQVYVIGGLVDRTILKYMSYQEATEAGVQAFHLPLKDNLGENKDLLV